MLELAVGLATGAAVGLAVRFDVGRQAVMMIQDTNTLKTIHTPGSKAGNGLVNIKSGLYMAVSTLQKSVTSL